MDKREDLERTHDLSIDEIRACEAYKNFTDEQAQRLIETLKAFTQIVFEYNQKKSANKKSEKEKVIPLYSNIKKQAA